MQFKRPKNTKTRDGVPVMVNSFQFLRAGTLVLSVKASELINGVKLPTEVLARVKGDTLTVKELAAWRQWKDAHDRADFIARFRTAAQSASGIIADTANAIAHQLVTAESFDAKAIWEAMDKLSRELKRAGLDRPARPRGRPKKVIYVDEESTIGSLPSFRAEPPNTGQIRDNTARRTGARK